MTFKKRRPFFVLACDDLSLHMAEHLYICGCVRVHLRLSVPRVCFKPLFGNLDEKGSICRGETKRLLCV